MIIPYYEEIIKGTKTIDMIKANNQIGLQPLNLTFYPLFINLRGNLFYGSKEHNDSKLDQDISKVLKIMFESSKSKIITPEQQLQQLISENIETLKLYKTNEELTGYDIYHRLNYDEKYFLDHTISLDKRGIYSEDARKLINSYQETKNEIYQELICLFNASSNHQELVINLLKICSVYNSEFNQSLNCLNKMIKRAHVDILVEYIGFDKIENIVPRTITTTKSNIYETFWNYILEDYNIIQRNRLIYDEKKNDFIWIKPNEFVRTAQDRECEEELELIKKYIPLEEREKFRK